LSDCGELRSRRESSQTISAPGAKSEQVGLNLDAPTRLHHILRPVTDFGDIHSTATHWYALKIAKGEQPLTIHGGHLDGVPYFEIELDGVYYWLTERGLFDPPREPAADT